MYCDIFQKWTSFILATKCFLSNKLTKDALISLIGKVSCPQIRGLKFESKICCSYFTWLDKI